jgi:hypothetical protein
VFILGPMYFSNRGKLGHSKQILVRNVGVLAADGIQKTLVAYLTIRQATSRLNLTPSLPIAPCSIFTPTYTQAHTHKIKNKKSVNCVTSIPHLSPDPLDSPPCQRNPISIL